jgi:hypothetical protein
MSILARGFAIRRTLISTAGALLQQTQNMTIQVHHKAQHARIPGSRRENIVVAVRCRPGPPEEEQAWKLVPERRSITFNDVVAVKSSLQKFLGEIQQGEKSRSLEGFQFDAVFDATSSTRQVYSQAAQQVVHSALDGVNGTILAYGQTGSGKSYTLMGDQVAVGMVSMSLMDIFSEIARRSNTSQFAVTATLIELYCEQICDLFVPSDGMGIVNGRRALQAPSQRPPVKIVVRSCRVTCLHPQSWSIMTLYLHGGALSLNSKSYVFCRTMNIDRGKRSYRMSQKYLLQTCIRYLKLFEMLFEIEE